MSSDAVNDVAGQATQLGNDDTEDRAPLMWDAGTTSHPPRWDKVLREVHRLRPDVVIVPADDVGSLRTALAMMANPPAVAAFQEAHTLGNANRLLVLAGDDPEGEADLFVALAAHQLHRVAAPSAEGVQLVERAVPSDVVRLYELLVARLRREVAVYRGLALEYQHRLSERERMIDELGPPVVAKPPAVPEDAPVFDLTADLVKLRARFAPAGSIRTRALDLATRAVHEASVSVLRLFDARDTALGLVHAWRKGDKR